MGTSLFSDYQKSLKITLQERVTRCPDFAKNDFATQSVFLSNTLQKGCKHQDDKSQKRSKVKEVSEGMQEESQSAVLLI